MTLHDPMDCSLPGSSIHETFQARVLEWVAIAFSPALSTPSQFWGLLSHTPSHVTPIYFHSYFRNYVLAVKSALVGLSCLTKGSPWVWRGDTACLAHQPWQSQPRFSVCSLMAVLNFSGQKNHPSAYLKHVISGCSFRDVVLAGLGPAYLETVFWEVVPYHWYCWSLRLNWEEGNNLTGPRIPSPPPIPGYLLAKLWHVGS